MERFSYRQVGRDFTQGVIDYLIGIVLIGILFGWLVIGLTGWGMDDSDVSAWNRSGMQVLTDHRTGVQYLYKSGSLIVRRDAEGNVITAK